MNRWPTVRTSLCMVLAMLLLGVLEPLGATVRYRFDPLIDDVGGRMASSYEITQGPAGFLWFAGDTEGLLRYDGDEFMVWATGQAGSLTRPNVSTIEALPDGRLWIGTWGNGLQYWSRERNAFVTLLADPEDPHALAENRVQRMFTDSRERLWIGTTRGLNYIDAEAPTTLKRFAVDAPDHPLYHERIWGIAELGHDLWFATSGGVYRLAADRRDWSHFVLDPAAAATEERGAEVRTIAVASGVVWAGARDGVYRYDADEDRFAAVPFGTPLADIRPRVNAILDTRDGALYAGGHNGLYRIDPAQDRFVLQGDAFNLLPDVDVRTLHEDDTGNLWIGTRDNGILVGRPDRPVFTPLYQDAPDALADEVDRMASAVHFDAGGNLWLGLPSGIVRRSAAGAWRRWLFPEDSTVRRIERIVTGPEGEAWIATSNGLFLIDAQGEIREDRRLFDRLDISTVPVNELLIDDKGALWVALWNYGIVRWSPAGNVISVHLTELRNTRGDFVNHLAQDESGNIWAATRFSGVFEFDGQRFNPFRVGFGGWTNEPPQVFCVVPKPTGLWLCLENGLFHYTPGTGEVKRYGLLEGLPSLKVSSVYHDTQTGDWVLTPQGPAWRASDDARFITLGIRDGLTSLSVQRNAIAEGPGGEIVIGTTQGAVRLLPDALPDSVIAPKTTLSRLWVEGQEITRRLDPVRPSLSLPYNSRDILMQFSVLDFRAPQRNRLRYRLAGFDEDFGPLTNERTVRYMNLPAGRFTLQVEGWSSRGVPSNALLEIPIVVATPWWQKASTWLIGAVLLAALLWMVIQLRIRALNAANVRLRSEVSAATRELQQANHKLEALAITDFLTGLLNRRGFLQRFEPLYALIERNPVPMTLVLFDLDHFKRINDSHGHDLGDEVLRRLGAILDSTLRSADLAARWGGEEFLLALPGTDVEGARQVCQKIRSRLRAERFGSVRLNAPVSATFGVIEVTMPTEMTLDELVTRADELLYQGKEEGRDRIVSAGETSGVAVPTR